MKHMKKITPLLIFILCYINIMAQNQVSKPEVKRPVYFDVSPPLRDLVKTVPEKADNSWKVIKNYFKTARNNKNLPPDWTDPALQTSYNYRITSDSTIQNFEGNNNTQGYDPPDTYGQVGLNHYFQIVNCHFSIYDKTGNKLLGPTSNATIWNGMPHNMNGGDGIVLYDAAADRWLVAQLSYPSGYNYEMIAVSQTNDPTGSWYRWEYAFNELPDYPKFGVWQDAYYMAVNRFGSGFSGTGQCAFDRNAMIAGDPSAQMIYFTLPSSNHAFGFLPSSCDGAFPPAGTPNYYVYMHDGPDYLGVYEFHADFVTPDSSTFGNYHQLPVNSFNSNLSGIPQKGTSVPDNTLSDRLMYRCQFRVFNDHWSMVTNHTVNVGSNRGGIRWYELQKHDTAAWAIHQQSTYAPADGMSRWMGSVALDTLGNIGLGFSISSSTTYPAIKFTGRFYNDSLNEMTLPEKGIFYGTGSNNANDGNGGSRWGDYSTMTVDPADGTTFWYSQEYLTTMGSGWHTRIASFNLASILNLSITATPDTICAGDSTQLNAMPTGGSGSYTYLWTSDPPGFNSTLKNPKASALNITEFIVTINDGTNSMTDSILVNVNFKATAYAGPNATYPNTIPSFPVAGTATNYTSVKWLTSGDGHFDNDSVLNCNYFPGAYDRGNQGALLTLQATPLRPCSVVTDTAFIRLTFPVGIITTSDQFSVNIIPNPTTGIFKLVVQGVANGNNLSVRISDLSGKTILFDQTKTTADQYSKTLDLSGSPKGIYMLELQTDTQKITKKVIIQ